MGQTGVISDRSAAPIPWAVDVDERYFADRLAAELRLAEAAPSAAERAVHLGACRYLCALLGARAGPGMEDTPEG